MLVGVALVTVLLFALFGVALIVGIWLWVTYNSFVRRRVRVRNGYSGIDVQLKRRYDLIPNLVETVKGYAAHEREVLEAVVRARQAGIDAEGAEEQMQAENLITGTLRKLFALSEAYPDLKANQSFLELQEALEETEDQIAAARRIYNSNVADYNQGVQVFPGLLVAGWFGFEREPFFEMEDSERAAPSASL